MLHYTHTNYNDFTDYSYFRCLRDIFGPPEGYPDSVDELYSDMCAAIADFENDLDYRIRYALDELMDACDTYYEDKVLQGFVDGFKLAVKIYTEIEYPTPVYPLEN